MGVVKKTRITTRICNSWVRHNVHLYLQFLIQLLHLYSMNHVLQVEMLFFWQKIFISKECLMSAKSYFSMINSIEFEFELYVFKYDNIRPF